jgi:DUF4097 and DUF4098 domain-containing protein YvlB
MASRRIIRGVFLLGSLPLVVGGCTFDGLWGPQVKFERTVELDQPMQAGATLTAGTASGSIDVTGRETNQAHVVATIQARAGTEDEARELAEQVDVHFEGSGDRVALKADHPPLPPNKSVSVSYRIDLPRQTSVELGSASGSINVADLTGSVKANTASGHVGAARVQGTVRLKSASGSAHAEDVGGGDIDLDTASGGVRLSRASNIGACGLNAASGSVTADNIQANTIQMSSASGHVTLTDAQAKEIRAHSSSGGVRVEAVTCPRLNAESASGHVTVAFARTAPPDVVATVSSGSGSVDMTAPRGFSGHLAMSTASGSVETDLPVTVVGKLGKRQLSGFVGKGDGSLTLRATSGSIRVR